MLLRGAAAARRPSMLRRTAATLPAALTARRPSAGSAWQRRSVAPLRIAAAASGDAEREGARNERRMDTSYIIAGELFTDAYQFVVPTYQVRLSMRKLPAL